LRFSRTAAAPAADILADRGEARFHARGVRFSDRGARALANYSGQNSGM
jgi:hypothetical protein